TLITRAPISTLFPYPTLFRSQQADHDEGLRGRIVDGHVGPPPAVVVLSPMAPASRSLGSALAVAPPACLPAVATVMIEAPTRVRSEEHTSELQSRENLVCRLL